MFPDLRYHIFTITAIFAALGLGILIGTTIIGNEGLIKEQNKMISNIGESINKLKAKNDKLKQNTESLRKELEYRKNMGNELLSFLLKERLTGNEYLLYTSSKENIDEVKRIFTAAGARLKIVNSNNDFNKINKNSKMILWDIKKNNITDKIKKNALIYNKPDIPGLIFTVMESKKDDNNR